MHIYGVITKSGGIIEAPAQHTPAAPAKLRSSQLKDSRSALTSGSTPCMPMVDRKMSMASSSAIALDNRKGAAGQVMIHIAVRGR